MSAKSKSKRSSGPGVHVTTRVLPKAPRSLSTIPRFTRTPQGFVVDTETGELLGGFGRRPTDDGWAWDGEAPRPASHKPIVSNPPSAPRRPPAVPKRVMIGDFRSPRLSVCIGRYVRRKVLFALGWHGRNGSGRSYRRNAFSAFGC